jgi:hypothetical protein
MVSVLSMDAFVIRDTPALIAQFLAQISVQVMVSVLMVLVLAIPGGQAAMIALFVVRMKKQVKL